MKSLVLSICIITSFSIADYTGSWEYEVDTPDMTYNGVLELIKVKVDGEYKGELKADGFTTALKDLVIDGDKMTCYFFMQGYKIIMNGTFSDNKLNGKVSAEGMDFPLIATKKE